MIGARKDTDTEEFRNFKRDLIHRSIATILFPLRDYMKTPRVVRCPDQYFRRVIYGLGPHISDYPEQATLASILLNWCPMYVVFLIVHPDKTLMLKLFQVASQTHTHSTPHAATGLRFTPTSYSQRMRMTRRPYGRCMGLCPVLR